MNREQFLASMDDLYQAIVDTNTTKGHDYAGDEDALANFKELGEDIGAIAANDPDYAAWFVYFMKHWSAVRTFLKEGDVKSEPIDGRVLDCILYLFLLNGLIQEKKEENVVPSADPSGRSVA